MAQQRLARAVWRRRRRTCASLATLVLLAVPSMPALGGAASATDPDDVDLRLDLRTISHTNDDAAVTYTIDLYSNFPDEDVDFRWGLDKNGDGKADLYVSAQWEDDDDTLVGVVDDPRDRPLAPAAISRPAPDAIRVSFPRSVLGGLTSYRYNVLAVTDLNGNGETDAGERDVAPNTGWYEHRLDADSRPLPLPSALPSPTTVSSPTEDAHPAAGPPVSPAPPPPAAPVGSSPPSPAASPAGAANSRGRATQPSPPVDSLPARTGADQVTSIPRTGLGHRPLAPIGLAFVIAGISCLSLAKPRRRAELLEGM